MIEDKTGYIQKGWVSSAFQEDSKRIWWLTPRLLPRDAIRDAQKVSIASLIGLVLFQRSTWPASSFLVPVLLVSRSFRTHLIDPLTSGACEIFFGLNLDVCVDTIQISSTASPLLSGAPTSKMANLLLGVFCTKKTHQKKGSLSSLSTFCFTPRLHQANGISIAYCYSLEGHGVRLGQWLARSHGVDRQFERICSGESGFDQEKSITFLLLAKSSALFRVQWLASSLGMAPPPCPVPQQAGKVVSFFLHFPGVLPHVP